MPLASDVLQQPWYRCLVPSCPFPLVTCTLVICTSVNVVMCSTEEDDLDEDDRLLIAAMERYEAQQASRSIITSTGAVGCHFVTLMHGQDG